MSQSPIVRAIIFDMDGVLCDSEPVHADAWLDLLEDMGHDASGIDTKSWVGKPDVALAHALIDQLTLSQSPEDLVKRKRDFYWRLAEERLVPASEVSEGFEELIRRKIPYALATSSSRMEAEKTLELLHLRRFFRTLVTIEDVTSPKPDPEPFLLAARRLEVDPTTCLVVEDSPSGIEAAHRAGSRVCVIRTPHVNFDESRVDYVANSIVEALQLAIRLTER